MFGLNRATVLAARHVELHRTRRCQRYEGVLRTALRGLELVGLDWDKDGRHSHRSTGDGKGDLHVAQARGGIGTT